MVWCLDRKKSKGSNPTSSEIETNSYSCTPDPGVQEYRSWCELCNKLYSESISHIQSHIHLLREIEALLELEKHLDWAITVPAEGPLADFSDFPEKRLESFFMKRLKSNPFWEDSGILKEKA